MAEHIFSTTEEITDHYPFLATIKFNKLKPSMKFVERRYIPELMDSATWADLLTQLDDIPGADDEWKELIDRVRDACAYLIALHYIPHGNVGIGEMGLQVENSEEFKPASKDRKNDLMRGIHEQAIDHLDLSIKWLNQNSTYFTDYAASDLFDASQASLINDPGTFSEFYPLGSNRWVWRLIKPWKDKIEKSRILGVLGKDYHTELITQVKNDSLTDENKLIQYQAQRALAMLTMDAAMVNLSIRIDETGVSVYNNASQPANDLRTTAEIQRMQMAQNRCQLEGKHALSSIESELQANAAANKYATFFNSDAYTAPADATVLNDTDENPNPGYFNAL